MERQERTELILDCAAALFAEKGIAGTTVRDIAGRAGILSGSLYHHFPSKDAMADHIVTQYLGELLAEYERVIDAEHDARGAVSGLVMASTRVSRAHVHASDIYQRETAYLRQLPSHDRIRDAARTIREIWLTVLERGVAAGDLRDDVPVELLYVLIRDAVWLTSRSFSPAPELGIDGLSRSIVTVFLDGATARPDGRNQR
ncbi:TetR/AcrR family transcriptional regulator [Microbacterium panaciterrae]|uniref:TetR family transcriptional regulator KstR2 n=1 Tax=Microbacterium panaciterrae TaxID=985759 RepID=A0ABP8PKA3_9MICO